MTPACVSSSARVTSITASGNWQKVYKPLSLIVDKIQIERGHLPTKSRHSVRRRTYKPQVLDQIQLPYVRPITRRLL